MDTDHTQSGEGTAGAAAGASAGELSTRAPLYDSIGDITVADLPEDLYQKLLFTSVYLGEGNSLNSRQHNAVNSPQQINTSSLSSQSGMNPVQGNLGSLQKNSKTLQQSLPKQQKQQMLRNQRQLVILQQLRQQQLMQQQIVQLRNRQMTDANNLKMRQQMGMNTGVLQPQKVVLPSAGSHHPQLTSKISPQNNLANLQHNSLSGVSTISNSPQNSINIVQPGSSLDLGQVTMQELATGSLKHKSVNSPQQVNKSSSSQSGTNPVQEQLGSLQLNSNAMPMLQNQQSAKQSNQLPWEVMFQRQQLMLQQHAMNSFQQLMQQNDLTNLQQQHVMNSFQPLMQQNGLTNLQNNSLSGLSTISNSQQHMINMVQPGSSLGLGQGNSLKPRQQVATGSLQQNPINSPQVNLSSLSSQSETNPVQANLGSLQQMFQTQQLKLQNQQLQMQLMQLQQALQQQMGMKTGVLQQQLSVGQLKPGISSSQLNQWKEKGKVKGDVTLQMELEPYTSIVEAPLDSKARTKNANGADQQEEVYQKAQNKDTLQMPLLGSSQKDMASASDGWDYGEIGGIVFVLLFYVVMGWDLLLNH